MKRIIVAAALLVAASTAFATDAPPPGGRGMGPGPNFDKVKADVAGRINARIARNQEELSCVQAAKNHADLKACREKFREEMKEQREKNRDQRPRSPQ